MKEKKTNEDFLYIIGWVLIGCFFVAALLILVWPDISFSGRFHCPFYRLTGYYCPGCGGTRAVKTLLKGRFLTSFLYHPFVLYTAVVGGWFMLSQTIERLTKHRIKIGMRYRECYLWIGLGLTGAYFILRNILLYYGIDIPMLLQ